MRFAEPFNLYFFFLILALAVFLFWSFKMRRLAREKFAQAPLLKELLEEASFFRQKMKSFLLVLAVVFIILALMRPQMGFQWEEIRMKGLDIIVAVDTSKSMLAQDILPSRLERAKLAIRDFIKDINGDRLGLVAFAGSAFLQCPLTVDYGGFLLALDDLTVFSIPKGGTSISSAIEEALKSYKAGEGKYKVLIIITDGEDLEGDALAAAEKAKNEGVTIYCIGVGTKEGELVMIPDETGQKAYLKDNQGNVVKSRLNEDLLGKIALSTGGTYLRATSLEFGLGYIYREKLSKMEKRELEGKMAKHYQERFQAPLAIAFLLLLTEALINDKK